MLTKHVKDVMFGTFMAVSFLYTFSASLAHRYWNGDFSVEKNHDLYGSKASERGAGADFEVTYESLSSAGLPLFKAELDHRDFVHPTESMPISSVEALTRRLIQKFGPQLESLTVRESRRLEIQWKKSAPDQLRLWWFRPVSVLWTRPDGGITGARLAAWWGFYGTMDFPAETGVWIPRSFLEQELERTVGLKERDGWHLPRPVNRDFLDALLNETHAVRFPIRGLRVETEIAKKWLIEEEVPSR